MNLGLMNVFFLCFTGSDFKTKAQRRLGSRVDIGRVQQKRHDLVRVLFVPSRSLSGHQFLLVLVVVSSSCGYIHLPHNLVEVLRNIGRSSQNGGHICWLQR